MLKFISKLIIKHEKENKLLKDQPELKIIKEGQQMKCILYLDYESKNKLLCFKLNKLFEEAFDQKSFHMLQKSPGKEI